MLQGPNFAPVTRLLTAVDERVSLKHVHRRLQSIARLLIVSTFIDDALRVSCDYRGQVFTMRSVGWGASAGAWAPQLQQMMPISFVLTQTAGVLLILTRLAPQTGCVTLIFWTAIHPFLYAQQRNLEFLLESVTIIGGIMILLTSERAIKTRERRSNREGGGIGVVGDHVDAAALEKNQLLFVGRLLLSAVFVYYSIKMSKERLIHFFGGQLIRENVFAAFAAGILGIALIMLTSLIIVGMKSRWCALLLAVIMGISALYKHPWFITMWSSRTFKLDFVVGYEDISVDAWLYSDHQRYFFFQQFSTAGALLQLVAHGPGQFSVDESEETAQPLIAVTSKGID